MTPAPGKGDYRKVKETLCLGCGRTLNAIGTMESGEIPLPNPGDPVACLRCGAVMTFEDGRLRGFTEREMQELTADPAAMAELAAMVKQIHFIKHQLN